MKKKQPIFWLHIIRDGQSSGVLVKCQRSPDESAETKYFWLPSHYGLAPTQEVTNVCSECHEIPDLTCNRLFIELLVGSAEAFNRSGHLNLDFSDVLKKAREDVRRIIDRFFERGDAVLREFLVSASVFKKHILQFVRGKEEILIKAHELKLLNPHDVVAIGTGYLKHIMHVLKPDVDQSRWFRPEGPLAVDFDQGCVYQNKRSYSKLNRMVMSSPVSLLEGEPATGKTVLVRRLGYELTRKENIAVYWFDGDLERGFDRKQLINEINGVRGVIILENVHLEAREYQRVLHAINNDPNRHVLFTANPSYRETQNNRDVLLSDLNHVRLEAFEDVDEIVNQYALGHTNVPWSPDIREVAKTISKNNYWILSYALEGYVRAKGTGEPETWPKKGVETDLRELCRNNQQLPEVAVALAALYRRAVPMEEAFLIKKLGFDLDVISQLVCRNQVTRQYRDEHVFYGLLHSSVAELYWKYGEIYRRRRDLPEYEELVYNYVVSGSPNGLRAVLALRCETRDMLLDRLRNEGEMPRIIGNETSMSSIGFWIAVCSSRNLMEDSIIGVLAHKISTNDDIIGAGDCLLFTGMQYTNEGQKLCRLLDIEKIAHRISQSDNFKGVAEFMGFLGDVNGDALSELCELLNLQKLVDKLVTAEDVAYACKVILRISAANEDKGAALWQLLDQMQLAENLGKADIEEVCLGMGSLFCVNDQGASDIWQLIKKQKLSDLQKVVDDVGALTRCIKYFFDVCDDESLGILGFFHMRDLLCNTEGWQHARKEFLKSLDLPQLAGSLMRWQDLDDVIICLAAICGVDCAFGLDFIYDTLGHDKTLEIMEKVSDKPEMYGYLKIICLSEHEGILVPFVDTLDCQKLASRISGASIVYHEDRCINHITEMCPDIGERVCSQLDIALLAQNLKSIVNRSSVEKLLEAIRCANASVYEELREHLKEE